MSTTEPETINCADCDRVIVDCSFCGQEGCAHALCYRCMILLVGQAKPEPHDHGG